MSKKRNTVKKATAIKGGNGSNKMEPTSPAEPTTIEVPEIAEPTTSEAIEAEAPVEGEVTAPEHDNQEPIATAATTAIEPAPLAAAPAAPTSKDEPVVASVPVESATAPAATTATPASPATPSPIATLDLLKQGVEHAKAQLDAAEAKAKMLEEEGRALVAAAKMTFQIALAPLRLACRTAGVACEHGRARAADVSEKISFAIEKVEGGLKVTVKGRPETGEVISSAALNESPNKAAAVYCAKHVGDPSIVGNKKGSLGNRLRAALKS